MNSHISFASPDAIGIVFFALRILAWLSLSSGLVYAYVRFKNRKNPIPSLMCAVLAYFMFLALRYPFAVWFLSEKNGGTAMLINLGPWW